MTRSNADTMPYLGVKIVENKGKLSKTKKIVENQKEIVEKKKNCRKPKTKLLKTKKKYFTLFHFCVFSAQVNLSSTNHFGLQNSSVVGNVVLG